MKNSFGWKDASVLILLLGLAAVLRFYPWYDPRPAGDEKVHATYVEWVLKHSWSNYPELVTQYCAIQEAAVESVLPPTRASFIALGAAVSAVRGEDAVSALRTVSKAASLAIVLVGILFGHLLAGRTAGWLSGLLLAVSPLQLHCARIGFVDVLFGLVVSIGLLGVVLLYSARERWGVALLIVAIPAIALTKESAVMVLPALGLAVGLGRTARNPTADRKFLLALLAGTALTLGLMSWLFGGVDCFLDALFATALRLPNSLYANTYQSGPWFRYLVDYLLVCPVLFLAFVWALGYLFAAKDNVRIIIFFFVASFIPMILIRGGVNLRFAVMWEPLLIVLLATALVRRFALSPSPILKPCLVGAGIAILALVHFLSFFPSAPPYDLVTLSLLRTVGIYRGDYVYDH